ETHGLREGGVGFENLRKPRPENNYVAIVTDSPGKRKAVKKIGREYVGKLHRVSGDRCFPQFTALGGDNVLQPTAGTATNLGRASAQEMLVSHQLSSNPISGFPPTFYPEINLNAVPFGLGCFTGRGGGGF